MKGSAPLRAAAAGAVAAVLGGESLQSALPAALARFQDTRALSQVQAFAYGSIRWFYRLDALLSQLLERPLRKRDRRLHGLLIVGLFDLVYGRTPGHAAVAETVNACNLIRRPRSRGLVNAVMRRFQRERGSLEAAVDAVPHLRAAHPRWLYEAIARDWPQDLAAVLDANNAHPPMWLRVNRMRADTSAYRARLEAALSMRVDRHPQAREALRLETPVPVSVLPGFAEGEVSVQDAAAQLAAPLLGADAGERVLDACAAPGGKTSHIAEHSGCRAEVTALDSSGERLERLVENLGRLRLENVRVVQGDALAPAEWWDGVAFDCILVDAPCSASGVIRRHPDIRMLRRASDLPALAHRQSAMLAALWPTLRTGGRLLYATCSILRQENEDVIGGFLAGNTGAAPMTPGIALAGRACQWGWQLLPGETGADGFYYACLEKTG